MASWLCVIQQQQQLKKEDVLLHSLEGEDVFHPDLKAISVAGPLPFHIHYVLSCNEAMESSLVD